MLEILLSGPKIAPVSAGRVFDPSCTYAFLSTVDSDINVAASELYAIHRNLDVIYSDKADCESPEFPVYRVRKPRWVAVPGKSADKPNFRYIGIR